MKKSVTNEDIDQAIVYEHYHVFHGRLTVCCLKLRNGFIVTGESCCVSQDNYNAEKGRRLAYIAARDKVWALEGYRLRDRLCHAEAEASQRV